MFIRRKSVKTTVFGVLTFVGMLCSAGANLVSGAGVSPKDITELIGAVGALGLGVSARDHDVTSEQAGAK